MVAGKIIHPHRSARGVLDIHEEITTHPILTIDFLQEGRKVNSIGANIDKLDPLDEVSHARPKQIPNVFDAIGLGTNEHFPCNILIGFSNNAIL